MPLKVAIPSETQPGESRVAMIPHGVAELKKAGFEILVQAGAGSQCGIADSEFSDKGATIIQDRKELFDKADVIVQVRALGANSETGAADLALMRSGQFLVASCAPLDDPKSIQAAAEKGITCLSLEMVPRTTRAQSMDVLSSMATLAGYKAVLQAALELPKIFPMMMTAAGTLTAARVFVLGAGVAGLQAMATAKRLGAVVEGYDIRPVVKDQVQSVGAKFVELDLDTEDAEGSGGYAKEQGEDFLKRQQALLKEVFSRSDVVITTANIPGRPAPELVTDEMLGAMKPGSVIIDLAAERGGNCKKTVLGQTTVINGVKIIGPENVAASIPVHASQMLSRNVLSYLKNAFKGDDLAFQVEDDIVEGSQVCHEGAVTHNRIRGILGLPEITTPSEEDAS